MKTILAFLILVSLSACSMFNNSGYYIEVLKPAEINVGLKPKISVIETKGSLRNLEDSFVFNLIKMGKLSGYEFTNKLRYGIQLTSRNYSPVFTNLHQDIDNQEYFLTMEIIDRNEDYFDKKEKIKVKQDTTMVEKTISVDYIRSEVAVQISLANTHEFALNNAVFRSGIEWKKNEAPRDKNSRYEANLNDIAHQFIQRISYSKEKIYTKLDASDERQERIIDRAIETNPVIGINDYLSFIASNPNNASAHYNLAVLYDVIGDYENAINHYNKSIALNPYENLYPKVKAECERRIQYIRETK